MFPTRTRQAQTPGHTHTLWVQQAVRSKRLDLKKVLGEENPADLFTKHSLSKERLDKLVGLFDCQFREGRAKSAPALRTGTGSKQIVADADRTTATTGEAVLGMEGPSRCGPCMPHIDLESKKLDIRYPSLEAVEELELEDLTRLEDEALYGAGMKIVQTILNEMATSGRTRKATQTSGEQDGRAISAEVSGQQVETERVFSLRTQGSMG